MTSTNSIITLILGAIMTGIFLTKAPLPNTGLESLDYILRAFYHGNNLHLLANMFTFINLMSFTNQLSTQNYISVLLFLLVVSSIIEYVIHLLLPNIKVKSIGFSGVLFGLLILYQRMSGRSILDVSTTNIANILPQIFAPGISFLGHLSGIIAGLLYPL